VQGSYTEKAAFQNLNSEISKLEAGKEAGNRLFYLALPPSVFADVTKHIKATCMSKKLVRNINKWSEESLLGNHNISGETNSHS
jgi:glucose-6-phosphate 1-dehydrogenase